MLQSNTYSVAGHFYFIELPFYILSSPAYPIYGAQFLLGSFFCANIKLNY